MLNVDLLKNFLPLNSIVADNKYTDLLHCFDEYMILIGHFGHSAVCYFSVAVRSTLQRTLIIEPRPFISMLKKKSRECNNLSWLEVKH